MAPLCNSSNSINDEFSSHRQLLVLFPLNSSLKINSQDTKAEAIMWLEFYRHRYMKFITEKRDRTLHVVSFDDDSSRSLCKLQLLARIPIKGWIACFDDTRYHIVD